MANQNKFSNEYISRLLRTISNIYIVTGKNRFSSIAYQNAAEAIETLDRPLISYYHSKTIRDVPHLTGSIGDHLQDYFDNNGQSDYFDSIFSQVPETFDTLIQVPSIGPKKAIKLIDEFQLNNNDTLFQDIVTLVNDGRVSKLAGFGKKSANDIKKAVEQYRNKTSENSRIIYPTAHAIAEEIIAYLKTHEDIKRADAMGSLRRKKSTIGDIDIAVVSKTENTESLIHYFTSIPGCMSINNAGTHKVSIVYQPGIRIDLLIQIEATYGSMLQYFTGSKGHNIQLRELGLTKGYSLSEHGIKEINKKDDTDQPSFHTFSAEEDLYHFLGLDYIEPEIREGTDEITLAQKNQLPKLITREDIHADFHIHSSYDIVTSHDVGANTYEEIIDYAATIGHEYVAFADHNPRVKGHTVEDIVEIMKRRRDHIESVLAHPRIPYFVSLEVDIQPDGSLALPEEAFEYVDFLVVAIHSSFQQERNKMTNRILKALSYPKVKILAHPTGRLLNKREGVEADWQTIFDFSAEKEIALEINAAGSRLDLPDLLVKQAKQSGCMFSIDSDAHSIEQMDNLAFGINVARRGWLEAKDVINTRDKESFKKWIGMI